MSLINCQLYDTKKKMSSMLCNQVRT